MNLYSKSHLMLGSYKRFQQRQGSSLSVAGWSDLVANSGTWLSSASEELYKSESTSISLLLRRRGASQDSAATRQCFTATAQSVQLLDCCRQCMMLLLLLLLLVPLCERLHKTDRNHAIQQCKTWSSPYVMQPRELSWPPLGGAKCPSSSRANCVHNIWCGTAARSKG